MGSDLSIKMERQYMIGQNDSNAIHLNKGKAYLQKLYDDLARR